MFYNLCASVALVIQHAKLLRGIILSSVAYPAVPYFAHFLIDETIFVSRKFCVSFTGILFFKHLMSMYKICFHVHYAQERPRVPDS
jgi:hypothetical protein